MTRAALLPAGADPFLNAYWLRHYRTWAGEVDELRMIVCGADPEVTAYMTDLAAELPNVALSFGPRADHGAMIGRLIDETDADHVLLIEDDAFIRRPGAVGEAFRAIEDGKTDLVACPRGSGTPALVDAVNGRYGSQTAPATNEEGPFYWPCFLFARRADLLATDRRFGAGEIADIERVLGTTFGEPQATDTFGWTSIQLRDMGLRVRIEAQFRAQLPLLAGWGDAPWFHVGSLSSGYGLYLMGPEQHAGHFDAIRDDLYDWNKRMSWWQRVWDRWDGALPELHEAYGEAIREYVAATAMDLGIVAQWRSGFDGLVTWDEA